MKKILRNTWATLENTEKKRFAGLIILDIVISTVDILSLALLIWIVRFYIQPDSTANPAFLSRWLADKNSVAFIAVFFLLFGAKNIAAFLISRSHYRFVAQIAIRISRNNLHNYQHSGFNDFVNIDSSIHIRQIAFQPFEFCQYILSGIQQVITQLCLILVAVTAILLFKIQLFLLLLCVLLPPVAVIFHFMKKRMDNAKKQIRENNEKSFQRLLDALKGYVESNIYDRNDFFMRRFINPRREFSKHLFDSVSIQNLPPRIIEVFAVLGLFTLLAIAKWTGNNDSTTLLTIGAFMAAAYKIIPGIVKIINAMGQIKAYSFSINDLVRNNDPGKNSPQKNDVKTLRSLELKNIRFGHDKQWILNDFSLLIQPGDFAGISGASGKGKTTLFNLALGFLTPQSGEIRINGATADAIAIKHHWPRISYVRQQSFFIHDTLLRNITMEEETHNTENLQYALTVAGLDELVDSFPEGLAKIIAENGKNISGGQQQRIAIARAIYKNADLILLDEPFNELDETSVTLMLQHFRELTARGKMVIMITHDQKSLSACNKIISLDEKY